jgi:hypothetical protein
MLSNLPAANQSWHQPLTVGLALLSGLLLLGGPAAHANPTEAFQICPSLADDMERLACFDRYVQEGPEEVMIDDQAVPLENLIDEDGTLFGFGIDGLTNHERNKLVARMDDNDISRLYMDAELSVKHPILSPVVDVASSLLNIDRSRNLPRLYLAFSTRFSQYIGSRDSAPVIARRYNPEIFLRVWRDGHYGRADPSYWDFGYGHESNGQQIETQALFNQVEQYYVSQNQPARIARDSISRGWDYVSVDWNKQWNTGLLPNLSGQTETEIEYRHYLEHGLFQGNPEEYNVWERDGDDSKTRDYYSGLSLSVHYDFVNGVCPDFFCFERVRLEHETGHAKPFAHNTTSLELTTNIAGLPINLWARSGYDSDLVDYYDYTNSWGLGIEFQR